MKSLHSSRLKLKVCGLTQLPQIAQLTDWKVDFLGFIFYEKSPRYVLSHLSLEDLKGIDHQGKVGVFVNETAKTIAKMVAQADLNLVQLHGDEDALFVQNLKSLLPSDVKIIKVIRVGKNTEGGHLQALLSHYKDVDYFLFDTDSSAFGGTGISFDWELLHHLEIHKDYFLSGGISIDNIGSVHHLKQQPFAIDINSKFEIEPGIKDLDKIKRLLNIQP